MNSFILNISDIISAAFVECGYDAKLGRVNVSNRPDLCEYQCNGAMAGAKLYKKAPIMIANDIVSKLDGNPAFEKIEAVNPGFINIKVSGKYLADYLQEMSETDKFGCPIEENPKKVIIDYGGPNVAKPLHIGHLRSAIIGESIKRINRYFGNTVIADVHLGDWGLQMGLIIEELKERKPELPYFDADFTGDYPEEAPFTISELEEIYPTASAKSKEKDPATGELTPLAKEFADKAHNATYKLQNKDRGYQALWQHILKVSIADLKKNYNNLNVDFDIWKGESDANPFIPDMIQSMKDKNLAYESMGALVMDVKEETDSKEIPPLLLMKSDGAALYPTTDLATLVDREATYKPDRVLYVVDKRQEMHFTQVFRAARKSDIVRPETELSFLGFGTMNGKDGKPFKTRAGGVMRLETLIDEIYQAVLAKSMESNHLDDSDDREKVCRMISMAALKYGDLSNQASKDYVFDIDRFASFDGNSGPYILYNMVRIKTILSKYKDSDGEYDNLKIIAPEGVEEKALMLAVSSFGDSMRSAYEDDAPHRVCGYIYELASAFNAFYNSTKILSEADENKKKGYIALINLTKKILEDSIELLGFEAPERM